MSIDWLIGLVHWKIHFFFLWFSEAKPKKKSAKQIAAEKEEAKKREQEGIRQQLQNAKPKTAEEIAEEKRRLLKAQEDSDFAMGADAFREY